MPVKKFNPDLLPQPKSKKRRGGSGDTLRTLEAPNPTLPAPTPEGPPHYVNKNQTGVLVPSRGIPTTSTTAKYNKDKLKDSWNSLSGQTMEYLLEVDAVLGESRLKTLLRETKLKDIGVLLGISTEKVLLMEGQPTQIVGQAEAKKLDDLLPALLNEVKRRGASIQVTERKADIKLDK